MATPVLIAPGSVDTPNINGGRLREGNDIADVGFHVLGDVAVTTGGETIELGTPKERQVLAVLLIASGEVVSRDRVIDALWPDRSPAKPMASLRVYLSHLRAALATAGLPKDTIVSLDDGYRLTTGDAWTDGARLESAVTEAGDVDTPLRRRIARLDETLSLVRGDPFADMPYAEFAQAEIQRLEELVAMAYERRAELAVEVGDAGAWIPRLAALVVRYPYRDGLRATHMRALALVGRRAEALRSYAEHRRRLIDETGLEPGPRLRLLEAELLADDVGVTGGVGAASSSFAGAPEPTAETEPPALGRTSGPPGRHPLFGRDEELALLIRRYHLAASGEGQVVVVGGEAGVGKTRLVDALCEAIAHERTDVVRLQCSPDHEHTALHPLKEYLRMTERNHRGAAPGGTARSASRRLLSDWMRHGDRALDVVSDDPDERRRALLRAAVVELTSADSGGVAVCVVEDVQWIDPSTDEVLISVAETVASGGAMLVVTHRTPDGAAIRHRSDLTLLGLGALPRVATADIVRHIAGDDELSESDVATIVDRANGVALFAEEMTHELLEGHPGGGRDVPVGLRESLTARLLRIGAAHDTVQTAAVLGSTFDLEVLVDVCGAPGDEVLEHVDQLCESGVLVRRGPATDAGYRFRHELLRDVAYDAIPASARVDRHRRVAAALGARADADPAQVARHWTEAGEVVPAVDAWLAAARRALGMAALSESIENARRGLEVGAREPQPDLTKRTLELHLVMGSALTQRHGPASPLAGKHFVAVLDAGPLASSEHRFRALWGRWYEVSTGQSPGLMLPLAQELLELSEDLGDECRIQAHHAMWSSLMGSGQFTAALDHVTRAKDLHRPNRHRHLAYDFGGHDPGACMWSIGALAKWMTGATDDAAAEASSAVEVADRLDHAYTQLEASLGPLTTAALDGDGERLETLVGGLEQLIGTGRVPDSARGYVEGHRGVVDLLRGDAAAALGRLVDAAPEWRELWGAYCHPLDEALARARIANEDPNGGLAEVDRVLRSGTDRATWWDAELLRCRASAQRARGDERASIGATLVEAADVAAHQGAVMFELRALTDLVELLSPDVPPDVVARLHRAASLPEPGHPDVARARRMF